MENLSDNDDDLSDKDDEKPQVVQLREGDLSAEQAATFEKGDFQSKVQIKMSFNILTKPTEEAAKKADLTQKVVFKAQKKDMPIDLSKGSSEGDSTKTVVKADCRPRSRKSKPAKHLLSFEEDDDDEA